MRCPIALDSPRASSRRASARPRVSPAALTGRPPPARTRRRPSCLRAVADLEPRSSREDEAAKTARTKSGSQSEADTRSVEILDAQRSRRGTPPSASSTKPRLRSAARTPREQRRDEAERSATRCTRPPRHGRAARHGSTIPAQGSAIRSGASRQAGAGVSHPRSANMIAPGASTRRHPRPCRLRAAALRRPARRLGCAEPALRPRRPRRSRRASVASPGAPGRSGGRGRTRGRSRRARPLRAVARPLGEPDLDDRVAAAVGDEGAGRLAVGQAPAPALDGRHEAAEGEDAGRPAEALARRAAIA